MTDAKDSPPSSRALRGGLTDAPQVTNHLRDYTDAAKLDRVWARLDDRLVRRSDKPGVWGQALAAAALLAIGIGVGMAVERVRGESPRVAVTASEIFAPTATSPAPRVEEKKHTKKKQPTQRQRSLPRRRAAPPVTALEEEPLDEATESSLTAEDLLPPIAELAPERSRWLALAERGEFAAAFQELDQEGGFDAVLSSGSAEELMTLADVARFAGRQGRAIQALRAVTNRYREDPNAPIAAMMLGNLLSRAGDAAGAAEAYALNRTLSPGGDFAEDALVREFDMAVQAGDVERVKRLLSQYEQEFPNGRHLEDMRSDAADLASEQGSTGSRSKSSVGAREKEPENEPDADQGSEPEKGNASSEQKPATSPDPSSWFGK